VRAASARPPRGPQVRSRRLSTALLAPRAGDAPAEALPPLRIGIVTEYFHPHIGGICEHVHHFALEARRRGHVVDIITGGMPERPPTPHVIEIGVSGTVPANGSLCRTTLGRGLRPRVRDVLERGRYDVLHLHAPLAPSLPLIAVEEARCPVVGTFHAYHEWSAAYALGRRWFQRRLDRIDACIAVSVAARDSVARYFTGEWTIVPNGVDCEEFFPEALPPPSLARGAPPTILYVGRFDPRNGLEELLAAHRLVRESGREARLLVVGDGPRRRHVERLAAGMPDVVFAGRVPSGLPGYYAVADIYACPAVQGSFGISLLEAMACGTAAVCYDTPGFHSIARDGHEVLMTPPHDVRALAEALARLLDDPERRRALGRAGRRRALGFAWPRIADRVLEIYARVLGPSPRVS
jgi:phosphatidylinositol alpha-mannosyltransferase